MNVFNLTSAVHIYDILYLRVVRRYDISYLHFHQFIVHGCITNSQNDERPATLIAELADHSGNTISWVRQSHSSQLNFFPGFLFATGGRGGVVVSALDFRSEGRWFDAQSLPSCCFLGQET